MSTKRKTSYCDDGCYIEQPMVKTKRFCSSSQTQTGENKQNIQVCYIGQLPSEVLLSIFKYLSTQDKYCVKLVCQLWRQVCSDRELWECIQPSSSIITASSLRSILSVEPRVLSLACVRLAARRKYRTSAAGNMQGGLKHTAASTSPIDDASELDASTLPEAGSSLRLQYLDLSSCGLPPAVIDSLLERCHNLRKLSLHMCSISSNTLRHVSQNVGLTELNLAGVMGGEVDLADVTHICQRCTKLTSLNVSCVRHSAGVSGGGGGGESSDVGQLLERLMGALPVGLTHLDVSNMGEHFTVQHIGVMSRRCPSLQYLDLSSCHHFNRSALQSLVTNLAHSLHVLVINHLTSHMSVTDFQVLSGMHKLSHVSVAHRYPEVAQNLRDTISRLETSRGRGKIQLGTIYRSLVASPGRSGRTDYVWDVKVPP